MQPNLRWTALLVSASLALSSCQSPPAPAAGNGVTADAITINFKDADKFTDVRDAMGGPTVPAYLDILARHLKEKAPAFLQPGQRLTVTFTDVDLAGDCQRLPGTGSHDMRIIKEIYRPRMDFNFVVHDATGQVVKEGPRMIQNLNFQFEVANTMTSNTESLFYDKALLTQWLQKEFKP